MISLYCRRMNIRARNKQDKKNEISAQNNAYDKNTRSTVEASNQDSFPPPPPDINPHDTINITENEYAYIAEMPLPPPILPGANGPVNSTIAVHSKATNSQSNGIGRSYHNGPGPEHGMPQPVAGPHVSGKGHNKDHSSKHHPSYPTGTYEKAAATNGPTHSSFRPPSYNHIQVTPKLLAHECALAVRGTDPAAYGHQKVKIRSPRSRLPSDGSDAPTYFELDPDAAVYNFSNGNETGTLPHNSPRIYRAHNGTPRSDRQSSGGQNTL